MDQQKNLSLLESLPQDLLGDILARVAATSRQDIRECLTVSKTIGLATQDDRVFKALNLHLFTMHPLLTYRPHYDQLMQKCMESSNPAALYIEGIKQYFVHDNTGIGLMFLKQAAEGSYDNGTYLYGILLLCTRDFEEGKKQLNSLGWEVSRRRSNRCWIENKRTLRYIHILRRYEYTAAIRNNRPPLHCQMTGLDTVCPKCYHYKQMKKFIQFIN